jgi:general secretion pathway protein M
MSLRERFEQLEPREQRLLGALVAVLVVMVILLIPALVAATVSSRTDDNDALRHVIERIHDARERIGRREIEKARMEQKYSKTAPPLAGYLDKLAGEVGIEIPESQDRAVLAHGKKFEERSTKLTLKKVGMLSLIRFLEKVENAGYPLRVSNLSIRKRGAEEDSFDVSVVVSAFDRKEVKGDGTGTGTEAER